MTQPTSPNIPGIAKDAPDPVAVSKLHSNSDVDASAVAQHHTLGIGANQSAAGTHTHDGKNSKLLGKGKDLAFPTTANAAYSQTQIQSIINALRKLGFGS